MAKMLWKPSEDSIRQSNLTRLIRFVNERHGTQLTEYDSLYQWSIDHIPEFWAALWAYLDIQASKPYQEVIDDLSKMPGAKWFSGAELNFAENLLRYRDDQVALVFRGEGLPPRTMTYAELYREVAQVAESLKGLGIEPGDRVVGFMPNMTETVVAMLAAASLGATWSSCSPDFGISGVLDRFGQIKPRVLFTADGYIFNGKSFDSLERITEILKQIPTIESVVVVSYTQSKPDIASVPNAVLYDDFKSSQEGLEIEFKQMPFSHPLYIMYSSGTTGLPKCMVQSAGGILMHQLKELILHTDLKREDTIFYFTTCGWMMWNWLVCSLGVGAKLVLYDGHPFAPHPGALWEMAQEGIDIKSIKWAAH